jgi:RNA polymerase sigma-70 factor (ECF subfamily)
VTLAFDEGEAQAAPTFAALFSEHAPFVLRVMRHLGVAQADLNDQSQEVFVAVFQGLAGFQGRSSPRTWIYGICVRVASNYRRRAYVRRERAVSEPPEVIAPPAQHAALEQAHGSAQLERLLECLDQDKRQVFVLYELEELPMKDVAAACDCPLQTAYSRLRAARRILLERFHAQKDGV